MGVTLTTAQQAAEKQILDAAAAAGLSAADAGYLIKVAYIESSLNPNASRSDGGTASGLFGYTDGTWAQSNSDLGSKSSSTNQISAMIREVAKYTDYYNSPQTNGNIPASMSRQEYMYIKHHDGIGSTPSFNAPGAHIWSASPFNPVVTTDVNGFISGGVEYDGIYDMVWDGATGYAYADISYTGNVEAIMLYDGGAGSDT